MNRLFPVRKIYVKSVINMAENPDNHDIFDESTKEIVVGTSENENISVTNEIVGPVHVHEPIIPLIDLVSESSSEKNGNDEVSSSTDWGKWYRGINPTDTSTPTNDPSRSDVRIEFLQRFVQENEGFNDLCGQPGTEWPMILSRQGLRDEYARVYAYAEREYPDVLRYNDYPHPTVIDRNPPNFRLARSPARSTDHADSEPDIGADLRRFFECKRSQSAVTGYRSPEWPPRSLLDQQGRPSFGNLVRMRPCPTAYQLPPWPSTSAGSMTWQETKRVLDPLNQESKKLLSDEFVREVELKKILDFKPKFEDDSGIAEVVNNAIRKHVGRRQRFLEVYQKIQDRLVQHLKLGHPIPDPNPGYYENKTDEFEEPSGEASPMVSMHRSTSPEQQGNGLCTPQCCVCNDDNCIWGEANYTD